MPELPEVETIRRTVAPHLIGRIVIGATLHRRDILVAPGDPPGGFSRQRTRVRPAPMTPEDLLLHSTVTDILRRGKQLAIIARSKDRREHALVVQLGMSGHLEFCSSRTSRRDHTHAEWTIGGSAKGKSGGVLAFSDARRFGALRVLRSLDELCAHWSMLGPDALTITPDQLALAFHNSDRPVKAALLDQGVLAGVGNIYADEALFLARIHPRIHVSKLRPDNHTRLAAAIRQVLTEACDSGGSTLRDFADADGLPGGYQAHHRVYGRAGLPCPECSRTLSAALLAQRTTVWCSACQPAKGFHQHTRSPRAS